MYTFSRVYFSILFHAKTTDNIIFKRREPFLGFLPALAPSIKVYRLHKHKHRDIKNHILM